jgi:ABC-type transporter Mla maintaining outer membrane lipid asymmetry ATPase subunit MlaF
MKAVTWDVSARQDSVLRPPRDGPATIAVRDLRKSCGDLRAVDGVTFEVGHGEFFGILGPNGAGKPDTGL